MKCETVIIKKRKVCAGDMNQLITLKTRAMTGDFDDVDFLELFTNDGNVWAAIQTTSSGEVIFDSVGTETLVTHKIYINYIEGLTQEVWIEFGGNNYDILSVENLDERNEFMKLNCVIRGNTSYQATFA
jgi:SPP1 family predicted phage head-tail adaptor